MELEPQPLFAMIRDQPVGAYSATNNDAKYIKCAVGIGHKIYGARRFGGEGQNFTTRSRKPGIRSRCRSSRTGRRFSQVLTHRHTANRTARLGWSFEVDNKRPETRGVPMTTLSTLDGRRLATVEHDANELLLCGLLFRAHPTAAALYLTECSSARTTWCLPVGLVSKVGWLPTPLICSRAKEKSLCLSHELHQAKLTVACAKPLLLCCGKVFTQTQGEWWKPLFLTHIIEDDPYLVHASEDILFVRVHAGVYVVTENRKEFVAWPERSRCVEAMAFIFPCLYITGGLYARRALNTTHVFNLSDGSLLQSRPMSRPRYGHASVTLAGLLYVFGGYDCLDVLASAECFDPATQQWREIACMPERKFTPVAAVVDGKIYVVGGTASDRGPVCYDPTTDQWQHITPMIKPECGARAVGIGHELFVVSLMGHSGDGECYNTITKTWRRFEVPQYIRWHAIFAGFGKPAYCK